MIRRLLVASLGIVLVVGLVGMGQAQKARNKKAQDRDGQSTPASAALRIEAALMPLVS